ncbi:helix-turn-helix transcriptional regulator [Phascolarctobacterium sp.]|uniref:helix-turn-helix domain-containing protein n=1 Tax=Phascolarctobacterium sp. TaxID=2049039 RepID=UPI0030782EB8
MSNNKIHTWIIGRIIELLARQNMTVNELADKCNLSPSTIQRYLNGKSIMKLDNIIKIANELSGSLQKFLETMDEELQVELLSTLDNPNT